ncbi:MAG: hypothetical protein RH978_15770 [Roseitalea porphyridii]|uniref:ABC transporter ATP-binding protein n=1 Tax=Roseitalea porphyridii TaxID=1852022 RepID=UPI0032EFB756
MVRHISHRIMVLYLGKMMEMADRDAINAQPRHPYTQVLISAVLIPDPDKERGKRRLVLEGDLTALGSRRDTSAEPIWRTKPPWRGSQQSRNPFAKKRASWRTR